MMTAVFDRLAAQKQIAELAPLGSTVFPGATCRLINALAKSMVVARKCIDQDLDLVGHLGARPEPIHLLERNHICTLNRINDAAEVDLAITALAELNVIGHDLGHTCIAVCLGF